MSRLGPRPAAHVAGDVEGDSASAAAVRRLKEGLEDLRAIALKPILAQALADMSADRPQAGAEAALKALEIDENNGWGWYILAICREKAGAFGHALHCYDRALALMPDNSELPNDLGRLASRMGMNDIAEKLFAKYLNANPTSSDGANNLACAMRAQSRFDDAVSVLKPYIMAYPDRALLWNTLGTVIYDQGRMPEAVTFFDEALRLDPGFVKARYNRANVLCADGRPREALAECEAAIEGSVLETETAMMKLARSTIMLSAGEVGPGWDAYEARLDPNYSEVANFLIDRPRWTPGDDIAGRSLLVFGEQGLGDEVLFANVLPDVIADLGDEALLTVVVESRLIPLFQASFPRAAVIAHATYRMDHHIVTLAKGLDEAGVDLWTPMASLLRHYRRSVEAFPTAPERFLKADPARVAHWRALLDAATPGPKVGVLWKSLKIDAERARYFSPFDAWRPVLTTPGATFVNLQYGDCAAELAQAREALGLEILQPPGVNLKDELAEVAALSCALDLVVGPANATTNIAAACGAPTWFISTPDAWPRLGSDRYPWYPQARVFEAKFNGWDAAMAQVAQALRAELAPAG